MNSLPPIDQLVLRAILEDIDTADPGHVVRWLAAAIATAERHERPEGSRGAVRRSWTLPEAPDASTGRVAPPAALAARLPSDLPECSG